MKHKKELAFTYTLLHFFVDFTTVFLVGGVLLGPQVAMVDRSYAIITYNLIAFAGQLPIGIVADVWQKNRLMVAVGCTLAALAYPVAFAWPYLACIFAAIGNGAFHIGAGADILKISMPKSGMSGLFVSSGALGVFLAYKATFSPFVILCPVIMLISALFLFLRKTDTNCITERPLLRFNAPKPLVLISISCFMLTIVIRSLVGMVMNFSWKAAPLLSIACVMAVVLGKAAGGFLCDKFGFMKTAVASLLIAFITFAFSLESPLSGLIAVFCFNMTMPLTLTAIASMCNNKYGFSFGLTTFALAVGFIPVVFGAGKLFGSLMLQLGSIISLLFIVVGYVLMKKSVKGRNKKCGS